MTTYMEHYLNPIGAVTCQGEKKNQKYYILKYTNFFFAHYNSEV